MKEPSNLEKRFTQLWKRLGGTPLETEHQFHPARKWRFDFADPDSKIAVEIEGGIWLQKSRHYDGSGAVKDMQKYLAATLDGWRIIRICGPMLTEQVISAIITFVSYHRTFNPRKTQSKPSKV